MCYADKMIVIPEHATLAPPICRLAGEFLSIGRRVTQKDVVYPLPTLLLVEAHNLDGAWRRRLTLVTNLCQSAARWLVGWLGMTINNILLGTMPPGRSTAEGHSSNGRCMQYKQDICTSNGYIHLFPPNLGSSARILHGVQPILSVQHMAQLIETVHLIHHKSLFSSQCKIILRAFTTPACLHYGVPSLHTCTTPKMNTLCRLGCTVTNFVRCA